jgi:glycosyltransferase involved in cell wall biosynthesis
VTPAPLRIALLVKALPLHRPGGQERHAWTLARGLAAAGHHVTAVTSAHPEGHAQTHTDGVSLVHLRAPAGGNSLALFRAIARWCRAFDGEFDIFHAQGFAAMLARPSQTPLVTTVHGTVWSETPLSRQVRPMLSLGERAAALWRFKARTLLGPLAHRAWARSARLIVDSDFTRGELVRAHPDWAARIDVVPLGVELPPELPERPPLGPGGRIRILCVGRVERVRGIEDLLEALDDPALRDRFDVTVVGDGPARRGLDRRAPDWHFAGRVDDEELAQHWRRADLFVNPEWSQPAFGLVTLEALSWGLPILGTQAGATPEIVTPETGWLVAPCRPEALREVLAQIAADPAMLRRRAAPARQRAEEFTVERMVEGTLSTYLRATGRF